MLVRRRPSGARRISTTRFPDTGVYSKSRVSPTARVYLIGDHHLFRQQMTPSFAMLRQA